MIERLKKTIARLMGKKEEPAPAPPEELCCKGKVHIFYRGLSDDRLYAERDRRWDEVRFFKPNGLKVFCADCRRSLL